MNAISYQLYSSRNFPPIETTLSTFSATNSTGGDIVITETDGMILGTLSNVNGNVVSGVTDAHLADDLFLEWSRIVNRNTFLTAGVSVSFPGAGIDNVVGQSADPWTGGFVNVVFNF